jgi:hypothetical protein
MKQWPFEDRDSSDRSFATAKIEHYSTHVYEILLLTVATYGALCRISGVHKKSRTEA